MAQANSHRKGRIYRLVYYSVILLPFGDPSEIGMLDIITRARVRNAALKITGVLYSDDHYFTQLLEGPRASVEAVFTSICRDRRHQDITVMEEGSQSARAFDGWDMEFVCDGRAAQALGKAAPLLFSSIQTPNTFSTVMAYIIQKAPAVWSAPPLA